MLLMLSQNRLPRQGCIEYGRLHATWIVIQAIDTGITARQALELAENGHIWRTFTTWKAATKCCAF